MYKSNSNSKSKPFLLHSLSARERYIQLITIVEGEVEVDIFCMFCFVVVYVHNEMLKVVLQTINRQICTITERAFSWLKARY